MKRTTLGKVLRIIAIVLLGLSAAVTLLSGIGITCVALGAEKYDTMVTLAPYKWFYQLSVLVTIAIGVYGIRSTIGLARSRDWGYRAALYTLIATIIFGGIHVAVSQALRGKAMPNELRVYVAAFTLIIFLLLRLPGAWNQIRFSTGNGQGSGDITGPAAAISLLLAGLAFLTVQYWAGPTHTWDGVNYADAFHPSLSVAGWGMLVASLVILAYPRYHAWIASRVQKVKRSTAA